MVYKKEYFLHLDPGFYLQIDKKFCFVEIQYEASLFFDVLKLAETRASLLGVFEKLWKVTISFAMCVPPSP